MQTRVSFILIFLFIMLLPMRVNSQIVTGAEQMDQYLPLLKGKRIGMVVNHTSVVGRKQVYLLDTLLKRDVRVVKVFAPEHGFRGNADAGETVKDGKDSRTGIPIVSLYGDNKKPSAAQLKDVDVIVFDIQDVGARFYTYISTIPFGRGTATHCLGPGHLERCADCCPGRSNSFCRPRKRTPDTKSPARAEKRKDSVDDRPSSD